MSHFIAQIILVRGCYVTAIREKMTARRHEGHIYFRQIRSNLPICSHVNFMLIIGTNVVFDNLKFARYLLEIATVMVHNLDSKY